METYFDLKLLYRLIDWGLMSLIADAEARVMEDSELIWTTSGSLTRAEISEHTSVFAFPLQQKSGHHGWSVYTA